MGDHVISALLTAFLSHPAPLHPPPPNIIQTPSPLIDSLQMSSVGLPVAVQDVHSAGRSYALQGNKQVSGQASEAAEDEVGQSVNTFWFLLSGSISCHCLLLPQHLDTQTTTLVGRDGQMAASKRNANLSYSFSVERSYCRHDVKTSLT